MRKLTQKQLDKKIELHQKWLNKEKGGKCLELENCTLENLSIGNKKDKTNLQFARFKNVYFNECKIHNIYLYCGLFLKCKFYGCLISSSEFCKSMVEISCHCSRFKNILWKYTDMTGSIFRDTKMNDNDFFSVSLNKVRFELIDLAGSTIHTNTSVCSAYFYRCSNIPEIIQHQICPPYGSFIGWKKVRQKDGQLFLLKLEIPEDAQRSSATTRKCRCSKAKVLGIYKPFTPLEQLPLTKIMHNSYFNNDINFVYEVGKLAIPDSFDENERNECSNGIHFFMTPEEAIEY